MNIIKTSKENMSVKEIYALTKSPKINKMSTAVGMILPVAAYALYEDTDKDGNTHQILSIMSDDGDVYATNSPTFEREFGDIVAICEQFGEKLDAIEIVEGTAKSGRTFITCSLA
nr:MAG TPA: ssDNA binding protein [Caudoviricetes sp.]